MSRPAHVNRMSLYQSAGRTECKSPGSKTHVDTHLVDRHTETSETAETVHWQISAGFAVGSLGTATKIPRVALSLLQTGLAEFLCSELIPEGAGFAVQKM